MRRRICWTMQLTSSISMPCRTVHVHNVQQVVASLANLQDAAKYVLDPDQRARIGSQWTSGFPDDPYPVIYRTRKGGPVHIQSKTLAVDPNPGLVIVMCNRIPGNMPSFCEPRKWGVRCCHLATPEYMRAALTGEVDLPIAPVLFRPLLFLRNVFGRVRSFFSN
jgi:hypothetical protein